MKNKKSRNVYSFPVALLKKVISFISEPFCIYIINKYYTQGICPNKLKIANVIPIFKKQYKLL